MFENSQLPNAGTGLSTQNSGANTERNQNSSTLPADSPLPRPQRQRFRARSERGLPADAELARLAHEYLQRQHKNWPKLAQSNLLPSISDDVVAQMVEDFKSRHRTGQVDSNLLNSARELNLKLAGSYNRYSCDLSSPTSILDQLVHALDKARDEGRFVPWSYVFCDYSISGLDSSRPGYTSYKQVLSDPKHSIETTYVDDFTRASRDEIEWWKLAALSKRLKKRMIGASDGFDLSAPDCDMRITLYGLISRLFIKGLREKVKRGMRGAARRRTCLGKQSLGFARCVARDEGGAVINGADGRPIYRPCIDPETSVYRQQLVDLYVDQRWSTYRIAAHFNQLRVDGWNAWSNVAVRKLLWSPTAIGVFIWNKTRRDYDWETEKWVSVENPRSQWEVYYDSKLAIVPMEKWKAARRRLMAERRKNPLTGRKFSRNQRSATTLFSGTLICEYCGAELLLHRSAGDYKIMACMNGKTGAHGCQLSTSKSTRIIEGCLLSFLRDQLVTEVEIEALVAKANAFLAEQAQKPRVDAAPLKRAIHEREETIKSLFQRIEGQKDEQLCQAYDKHIAEHQRAINQMRAELHKLDAQNIEAPPFLDAVRLKSYLDDIRGLMNQEISASAEVIRALTGPIKVRQELIPGRKTGARWFATFSPNLLAVLQQVAKNKNYPDSITLEFLCSRNWIIPTTVDIPLEKVPKYELLAPKVKKLHDQGASLSTIASVHQIPYRWAGQILEFAETGKRPTAKKPEGPRAAPNRSRLTYRHIVDRVAHLRDFEELPFHRIAARITEERQTRVSEKMVKRAYDVAHPEIAKDAIARGETPRRGRCGGKLGEDVHRKIREGLANDDRSKDIARTAGCSVSLVNRLRRNMHAEEKSPST